ncbi:hypothetical protein SAMN05720766_105147 [Fibrobacter sp. UWH9]|uniref:hypothetical protein n=1 Tax=unclassified Fibrobacter TaxID=2634177 RepID=UPI00091EE3BE|nr:MULTISPECIES: hypothetical protein [unclassified Fibrobacter]SHG94576.1 hypothetical protein SAMN05720766_105147 [Fibrobacter sp. UWH9]
MTLEQELNIRYKKGRVEEKVAVARRMFEKEKPIAEIVEFTGLSEAEVLELQKEMQ